MRFHVDGLGIEYTVAGPRTGLPIVCIHGFPFSKEMWEPQAGELAKEHYVVTYDVRGHGRSDAGDYHYSLEFFVDELIALLDHLKIARAVLMGLSMGGYIALRARERHPDRVRALILCDTKSEPDNNEGKIRRAESVRRVKSGGMDAFAGEFLKNVFYEKTFAANPAAVEMIRKTITAMKPEAVAGTLLALAARTDTTPSLFSINLPALILVGQHDAVTPPSASNSMKEKIPGAVMHVIPNAAHLSNLENSPDFNRHLLTFLKTIRS